MGLEFSWWMLFAALGSTTVGLLYTVLVVRQSAGGGLRTVGHAIRGRLDCLAITVTVDAIGSLVVAVAGAALSLSQPESLVYFVNTSGPLGWFLFGLVGPVVGDRLFTGSVFQSRFSGWMGDGQQAHHSKDEDGNVGDLTARSWRLRSEAVLQIQMRCWVIVQRRMLREAIRLRELANLALADRRADLNRLPGLCLRLPQCGFTVPATVTAAAARAQSSQDEGSRLELVDALIEELLVAQVWFPLYVLFGEVVDSQY